MVAVRLSIIADKKKARKHIIHNIFILLFVLMRFLIVEKPLKKSIISTIVIAPIKKIRISAVWPKK